MNSRLEQFVRDHREEFDGEEPDNKIWDKIRTEMTPQKKKGGGLVRLSRAGWAAAAAVVLVAVGSVWYFSNRTTTVAPGIVRQTPSVPAGTSPAGSASADSPATSPANSPAMAAAGNAGTKPGVTDSSKTSQPTLASIRPKGKDESAAKVEEAENSMDEEMYHYAKLVEIKHNQLKAIEKDEPLLYKQFASDVNKLDSVYQNLQSQLPKNPNREQLLEAMLQNLQLQMGLLNHQLDIIKQINHSKKTAYEEAHKTA
jgi:hypothetical protein